MEKSSCVSSFLYCKGELNWKIKWLLNFAIGSIYNQLLLLHINAYSFYYDNICPSKAYQFNRNCYDKEEIDMKKLKTLVLLLLTAITATVAVGCGSTDTAATGDTYKVLKFGQATPSAGLDMQKSTSSTSASIADSVTESLLRFNDSNEEEPVLLTGFPTVSEDGRTYSFELKQGVTFTNGTELKSSDVKYTFERMFNPETKATSYGYFNMITGAQDILNGTTKELSGFQITDDYHFTITLDYAYAPFVKNLGTSYAAIFPQDACEAAGDNWGVGENLIGTGPYKIKSNDDTTQIVLVKNESYHGGTVNLDELQILFYDNDNTKLLAYENGDIDLCDLPASLLSQYQTTHESEITKFSPLGTGFISLNLNAEYCDNENVRKAMSLAINREELVATILNGSGTAATSYLNPSIPGHDANNQVYEYNPDKAKELLAQAGYADGITLTAEVRQADQTLFTAIQEYFSKVGITLNLNVVDNATWTTGRTSGNLTMTGMTWNALYPDADFQMYNYFYSTKATGKGVFYKNAEYDSLLDEARAEQDETKRAELYTKADEILSLQDYACIPLYYPQFQFVAKPYVKNMAVGNLIYHFWNVDVDMAAKASYK